MPESGRIRRRTHSLLPALLLYGALAAGVALTLTPLLWMLAASLMPAGEASHYPPRL